MITGSCLCGAVRYRLDAPAKRMTHCHCSMCRKAHGAAFATYVSCAPSDLRWLSGEPDVVLYQSSPGVQRAFCHRCGSVAPSVFGEHVSVPAGNLDGDPGARPSCHIFTAETAPWHVITDDLPRHDNWDGEGPRPAIQSRQPGAAASALRGSCLCGRVTFEVVEPIQRANNCYCSRCRKARSAAHASNAFTSMAGARFTGGEDNLASYKLPEARFFTVTFCRTCGSGVPRLDPGRNIAVIPMGALDDDPQRGIDSEIFTAYAAPWYPAAGAMPRFAEAPG